MAVKTTFPTAIAVLRVCNEAEIANTGMCVQDKTCGSVKNTVNVGKCTATDIKSKDSILNSTVIA